MPLEQYKEGLATALKPRTKYIDTVQELSTEDARRRRSARVTKGEANSFAACLSFPWGRG